MLLSGYTRVNAAECSGSHLPTSTDYPAFQSISEQRETQSSPTPTPRHPYPLVQAGLAIRQHDTHWEAALTQIA